MGSTLPTPRRAERRLCLSTVAYEATEEPNEAELERTVATGYAADMSITCFSGTTVHKREQMGGDGQRWPLYQGLSWQCENGRENRVQFSVVRGCGDGRGCFTFSGAGLKKHFSGSPG